MSENKSDEDIVEETKSEVSEQESSGSEQDESEAGGEGQAGSEDDDEDGGVNDDDEFESSDDEEDELVFQELVGMKRSAEDTPSEPSSGKKAKSSGDGDDDEVRFVPDDMEEIAASNIIPRGKRRAALNSGLVVQENKFKNLVDDSDGEADF